MQIIKNIKAFLNQLLEIAWWILVFIIWGGWVLLFIWYSVVHAFFWWDEKQTDNMQNTRNTSNYYESPVSKKATPTYTYQKSWHDTGYEWAEDNDIDNFDDCQSEFGTSDEEDGCNQYVKQNYTGYQTFGGYECTEDCSWHEAWYEWAEEHDISDSSDCESIGSSSFGEGCQTYVDENY